nr:MAG TPA: PROTEIN (MANNOSE-BINDING PROTEIN A), HOST DEFENSE, METALLOPROTEIN, SUGAR.9A [Caudoviricetes sp.]
MTAIWWTIYILAAFTIVIVWLNLITLFIRGCTYIFKSEWCKVKVIEGPPGPQGPPGETGGFVITKDMALLVEGTVKNVMRQQDPMSRKDIEAFIRMEIASQLEKYEIFRNTYPGLMKDEFKLQKKEDK